MKSCNRRTFLKTSAAVTAGTFVLPQFSIGKPGPLANGKLNIAMIGAGNIAEMAYEGCEGENIVALCDVDSDMFDQWAEDFPFIQKAKRFSDFRVMFDKMADKIDAVCVSTPDHTHFAATMAAMEHGKHVFTQKPLTHTVWQARTLRKAMHKYKVITNMGNQGHTYEGIRRMREWYEAGVFGQITEVHSWVDGPEWGGTFFAMPSSFPPPMHQDPKSLDYDLWLGPSQKVPYNEYYHPLTWRGFNQFGGGQFADWFCHIADAPVWILDLYEPVVIEAEEVDGGNKWMAPNGNRVRYEFAKRGDKAPCTFYWHNGPENFRPERPEQWTLSNEVPESGSIFIGTKETGYTDERSSNPRLVNAEKMRAFNKAGLPPEKYPRVEGGPVKEWVRAVKGLGPEPGSNFDYAAPMTEVMLLGIIAIQHGGKIEWDSKEMKITNRPELNRYLTEPVREGWEYGQDLWD